ncbi:MAG TPA: efflux RND transporter periplasmic adaptor subunit [Terriglobia bacterium]|jgi:cobalt-zinc-cadmium efflux system membrane fusion protein|nr:efflux RND transporter periplasmic adaptor subunit [Terriglobia bacterium]
MIRNIPKLIPVLLAVAAAGLLAGCNQHGAMDASEPKPDAAATPGVFSVADPQQFPLVSPVVRQEPEVLLLNGVVAPDITRTIHINALAGGRVLEVRAKLGDDVQKGQLLLVVHSPDLEAAIQQYQKDRADDHLAEIALKRAHELFDHGAMAQQDLENAENVFQKAEVDTKTDADQIRLLGGDIDRLSPTVDVRSPVGGVVVDQQVANGEAVKSLDNSQSLFMVADLSRVWVLCDVYENDLGKVRLGDIAEVRLNAYPDRDFRGTVGNISQVLDPATRTAKVRVELANPQGLFRPQMFATIKFTSRRTYPRLLLPATAILRLHDKDWIFVKAGDRSFRLTPVRAGESGADGTQEILSGVQQGDQVASNALEFASAVSVQ